VAAAGERSGPEERRWREGVKTRTREARQLAWAEALAHRGERVAPRGGERAWGTDGNGLPRGAPYVI